MLPSSSVYDGLRGAAVEWAWFLTHWALYPLGVAAEAAPASPGRLDTGSAPVSPPESEGVGRPVLLVHGWGDNRAVFTLLRRSLQRAGFPQVLTTDYSPLTCDVREAALRLGEQVETVCRRTGYDRLHVVGHSLGGIITRYYVQRLGGDERVHTLVTLGSPHTGTAAGWWLPHPLVRQLQPGSGLIRELTEPAPGCRTRFVAVWSDLDSIVVPAPAAALHHPDLIAANVFVPATGHLTLAYSPVVASVIGSALAGVDPRGRSSTP